MRLSNGQKPSERERFDDDTRLSDQVKLRIASDVEDQFQPPGGQDTPAAPRSPVRKPIVARPEAIRPQSTQPTESRTCPFELPTSSPVPMAKLSPGPHCCLEATWVRRQSGADVRFTCDSLRHTTPGRRRAQVHGLGRFSFCAPSVPNAVTMIGNSAKGTGLDANEGRSRSGINRCDSDHTVLKL